MSEYRLIAFDMDGTLLNSKKEIDQDTRLAMEEAAVAGKAVVINSGRAFLEMKPYLQQLPFVSYVIGTSGAFIYDCARSSFIYKAQMDDDTVHAILAAGQLEETMAQIMTADMDIIDGNKVKNCAHYQVPMYQQLFDEICCKVDDVDAYYRREAPKAMKVNLYHADIEGRKRTRSRLAGINAEPIDSDIASLEFTPKGVSKASGHIKLCQLLGISTEETIAVGDGDNDICMLEAVGLPIAMANANDRVKAISGAVVADCDHNGCAEAIRKYLL